jgi:hypothetical protein
VAISRAGRLNGEYTTFRESSPSSSSGMLFTDWAAIGFWLRTKWQYGQTQNIAICSRNWLTCEAIFETSGKHSVCRCQWPRGLRCGSAVARLRRSRVRIPPKPLVPFSCVLCCQVEISATGWSLVQRSPTECLSECDIETQTMSSPFPMRVVDPWKRVCILLGMLYLTSHRCFDRYKMAAV